MGCAPCGVLRCSPVQSIEHLTLPSLPLLSRLFTPCCYPEVFGSVLFCKSSSFGDFPGCEMGAFKNGYIQIRTLSYSRAVMIQMP